MPQFIRRLSKGAEERKTFACLVFEKRENTFATFGFQSCFLKRAEDHISLFRLCFERERRHIKWIRLYSRNTTQNHTWVK